MGWGKTIPGWKIVVVSHMRLGTIPVKILQHNIQTINSLNPDIALMLGNQFVVDWRDLGKTRCANALDKIQASKVKGAAQQEIQFCCRICKGLIHT